MSYIRSRSSYFLVNYIDFSKFMPLQKFMQNSEAPVVRKSAASMLSGKRPALSAVSFFLHFFFAIIVSPCNFLIGFSYLQYFSFPQCHHDLKVKPWSMRDFVLFCCLITFAPIKC